MGRVQGKTAIVSGGAGGLGAATCRLLAQEGAKVVVGDLAEDAGRALASEIGGDFHRLDVTSEDSWKAAVAATQSKHGGVDILVSAAGVEGELVGANPETISLAEWRRVHGINLDGVLLGCKTVLPVMKARGAGSIINISSIVSTFATPSAVAYGSSKAGVMQLSKSVALHGAKGGAKIRCNSVHPGVIKTRMVDSIFSSFALQANTTPEALAEGFASGVPLGELGEPQDVAYLILYLASDESRYVTGSEFQIDGGWHLIDAG